MSRMAGVRNIADFSGIDSLDNPSQRKCSNRVDLIFNRNILCHHWIGIYGSTMSDKYSNHHYITSSTSTDNLITTTCWSASNSSNNSTNSSIRRFNTSKRSSTTNTESIATTIVYSSRLKERTSYEKAVYPASTIHIVVSICPLWRNITKE
uniref:Uncharacterized protein n=1 Tax=Spongospora subterranea TaxID=70186 RepID=A0A0H5RVH4_9EUKA|eukprot:CRZ12749.1 hypothetical protein [Spongospora subterranea]